LINIKHNEDNLDNLLRAQLASQLARKSTCWPVMSGRISLHPDTMHINSSL